MIPLSKNPGSAPDLFMLNRTELTFPTPCRPIDIAIMFETVTLVWSIAYIEGSLAVITYTYSISFSEKETVKTLMKCHVIRIFIWAFSVRVGLHCLGVRDPLQMCRTDCLELLFPWKVLNLSIWKFIMLSANIKCVSDMRKKFEI